MLGEVDTAGSITEPVDRVARALQALVEESDLLLVGLDRDGTLIPIAERPEEAVADPEIQDILSQLCTHPHLVVAIVSARSRAQLRADFPMENLTYGGNYGMEIQFPSGLELIQEKAARAVPFLKEARDKLAFLTEPDINAILEDHGYSLCLHWHSVPTARRGLVHESVAALTAKRSEIICKALPTSYEFVPNIEWSKADALAEIRAALSDEAAFPGIGGTDGCRRSAEKVAFAFFGDSGPDEAAFSWVNRQGGVSVKVGTAGVDTAAKLQLPDTRAVRSVLSRLQAICR